MPRRGPEGNSQAWTARTAPAAIRPAPSTRVSTVEANSGLRMHNTPAAR